MLSAKKKLKKEKSRENDVLDKKNRDTIKKIRENDVLFGKESVDTKKIREFTSFAKKTKRIG